MYNKVVKDKSVLSSFDKTQQFILHQADAFLQPYTNALYQQMDVRLVRTFHDAFVGILVNRNNSKGLILSELGGYIAGLLNAVSGTKRLGNLFRSERWCSTDIEKVRLSSAQNQVAAWSGEGRRVLGFIDDSTLEKPESWFSEGLCAVYSSKAQRLTRIKKGYYHPPVSRLCVPGFEWTALMIGGLRLVPMVGLMTWWTKRGWHADSQDNVFYKMLKQIKAAFGSTLTLVLDRGFANLPTLERLFKCDQFFIIRWKNSNLLVDLTKNSKNTWRICHGKKAFHSKVIFDTQRKKAVKIEIIYAPVWHPEHPDKPMTLVVVRHKTIKNQQPMYLLTNQEVDTVGMAWEIFYSYMQRWDIEQAFRFNKSELGIQTIRVWKWETRLKIMALISIIYQFLLQFWRNWQSTVKLIIRKWCPRTDKRLEKVRMPLYRLRMAIQALLLEVWVITSIKNRQKTPLIVMLQN